MILKINNKDVELKFNIGFMRRLDDKYKAQVGDTGLTFGAGLLIANVGLTQMNPVTLSEILFCAAKGVKQADVDEAIDRIAEENDGLEDLFEEVKEELGKSPVVKNAMSKLKTPPAKEAEND